MITKENLIFCFENLKEEEINKAFEIESEKDYILFSLHVFNIGGFATIKAYNYDEEKQTESDHNGSLFMCKDDFLQLYKDSKAQNKHLDDLI